MLLQTLFFYFWILTTNFRCFVLEDNRISSKFPVKKRNRKNRLCQFDLTSNVVLIYLKKWTQGPKKDDADRCTLSVQHNRQSNYLRIFRKRAGISYTQPKCLLFRSWHNCTIWDRIGFSIWSNFLRAFYNSAFRNDSSRLMRRLWVACKHYLFLFDKLRLNC